MVTDGRVILAQHIASQDDAHRPYGGVVPEIAARAHVERVGARFAPVDRDRLVAESLAVIADPVTSERGECPATVTVLVTVQVNPADPP